MILAQAMAAARGRVAAGAQDPRIALSGAVAQRGALKVLASFGAHSLIVDEPQEIGGEDSAMNPAQVMLSGVAAGLFVTTRLMAADMNLDVGRIGVTISAEMDVRAFLGVEGGRPGIFSINAEIDLARSPAASALAELRERVLDRCPTWRALAQTAQGEVRFHSGGRTWAQTGF